MEDTGPPDLILIVPDNAEVRMSEGSLTEYPFTPTMADCDYAKGLPFKGIIWSPKRKESVDLFYGQRYSWTKVLRIGLLAELTR